MKRVIVIFLFLMIVFEIVGCSMPQVESTIIPATQTSTSVPTLTPVPTLCSYVWATRYLEDLSLELQNSFKEAGYDYVTAYADAYGQNCLDFHTKEVTAFTPVETNLHMSIQMETLTDEAIIGNTLAQILPTAVSAMLAHSKTEPGYMEIRIADAEREMTFVVGFAIINRAVDQGINGANLYRVLSTYQIN